MSQLANVVVSPYNQYPFLQKVKSVIESKLQVKQLVSNEVVNHELLDWVSNSDTIELVKHSITIDNVFTLEFKLNETYHSNFVLLRGLLEFTRPKLIVLTDNRVDKTFTISFSSAIEDESLSYLDTAINWLHQEIQFKKALKKIIAFEEKYNRDRRNIYDSISILDTH
jgi:hypothetical protein